MHNKPSEKLSYLFGHLESIKEENERVTYWNASELQHALSFNEQHSFFQLLGEAKAIAAASDITVGEHFIDSNEEGVTSTRLTRYACHLIVRGADTSEEQVAFAQNYFASKNRGLEAIIQRMHESERVSARNLLTSSEKNLSGALDGVIGDSAFGRKAIGLIRTYGDQVLFGGNNTQSMKIRLGIPKNRPLADFMPTPIIEAKTAIATTSSDSIVQNFGRLKGDPAKVKAVHEDSSKKARARLYHTHGIKPEWVRAEEDIKKVERRLAREEKEIAKDS